MCGGLKLDKMQRQKREVQTYVWRVEVGCGACEGVNQVLPGIRAGLGQR